MEDYDYFVSEVAGCLRIDDLLFNKASDFDLGYLAGIIDGEGCFSLERNRENYYYPVLKIAVTSLDLFFRLKRMGINSIVDISKKVVGRKPLFRIRLMANDLRIVLPKIIDLLSIKRKQAEVISEVLSCGRNPVRKKQLKEVLSLLNERGDRVG